MLNCLKCLLRFFFFSWLQMQKVDEDLIRSKSLRENQAKEFSQQLDALRQKYEQQVCKSLLLSVHLSTVCLSIPVSPCVNGCLASLLMMKPGERILLLLLSSSPHCYLFSIIGEHLGSWSQPRGLTSICNSLVIAPHLFHLINFSW